DGACNVGDGDDDNDGVDDGTDTDDFDPRVCGVDGDADQCDDCSQNPTSTATAVPWTLYAPNVDNDGLDTDGDQTCNVGDDDDDNDGVMDGPDSADLDPRQCVDGDTDGCDDCSQNPHFVGDTNLPWTTFVPSVVADGLDTDSD